MGLSADHAAFVKFTDTMKTKFDDINGRVRVAHDKALSVNNGSFQGLAGSAFQTAFDNFLQKAQAMNHALMQNAENLEQVTKQFGNTEQDQLAALQSAGAAISDGGAPAPTGGALNWNTQV
ncbi:WXG100 family type VII secretion target [Nocardia wallacei]|uniref:WXG100 family type VII secretion target n=1 Tax=Nocardia wallacei TaxID=480035 RepID=UPI002456D3A8|nr:WXG100 family type VII secretion target [Nocardia wallacei]